MTDTPETVRSYQRIFRPERRIYSIDGRPLPVPGGVPLDWLAYASGTLIATLLLATHSIGLAILIAAATGLAALGTGGRKAAVAAGICVFAGIEIGGWLIALLDWPLRLIVLPALIATLATQATPDGRTATRFAISWVALRLAPRRRSLGRELPPAGWRGSPRVELWVAADERGSSLRRGRVKGPAEVSFSSPVDMRQRHGRRIVRRLGWHRRRGTVAETVELAPGEVLEVKP